MCMYRLDAKYEVRDMQTKHKGERGLLVLQLQVKSRVITSFRVQRRDGLAGMDQ